jgi:hypothetical protein
MSYRAVVRFVAALSACAYAFVIFAFSFVVGYRAALVLGVGLGLLGTWRLWHAMSDPPRSTWVVRGVDEPMVWQWAGSVFGLLCFVALAPVLFVVALVKEGSGGSSLGESLQLVTRAGTLSAYAFGLAVAAWGVWGERRRLLVRHYRVPIERLPPELHGYRVVHLSDLHIGGFDGKEKGLRWVAQANALAPDLVAVTGDLVTSGTAYYEDAARVLERLSAVDGVCVSLGNHDQWDQALLVDALRARGLRVLDGELCEVERGGATLIVAGSGAHPSAGEALRRCLAGREGKPVTMLLAHFPSLHGLAERLDVDLVLSGHTHGGQIGVPLWADRLNAATLLGQHGRGLHHGRRSVLHVSAGLGTTGPPLRLAIPPEIAVLELWRSEPSPPPRPATE